MHRSLALLVLVACGPDDPCDEEGVVCECIASRRLPDGTCCPGFTRPDEDVCLARTWTLPGTADRWGEPGASQVQVAVDGEGRGVAGWIATTSGQPDGRVVIAEETDSGWTLQEPAVGLDGFGARPSLSSGADSEVMLAWKQAVDDPPDPLAPNDIAYVSPRHADGTWGTPAPLSLPPAGDEPRPLVAASGEALVVWNQWTSSGYGVALARRPADDRDAALVGPSEADDVLSPPVANSNDPRIAVGANGDALVVWYQAPTQLGNLMIFASERYRVDGEFNRPAAHAFISREGADARNPMPAVGDHGHAAVVWEQGNGRGDVPIYLATRDGLGNWTVPVGLGEPFSPAEGTASDAQVVFGRGTELFVVWTQEVAAKQRVFAAHRNAAGEWDEPGREPTPLSSDDHHALDPSLAAGPDGEVIVVWTEIADGTRWRIAARRRNADATRWSELDVLSPADGSDAEHPVAAIGATGRVVVAWQQGPPGQQQIRFASMD